MNHTPNGILIGENPDDPRSFEAIVRDITGGVTVPEDPDLALQTQCAEWFVEQLHNHLSTAACGNISPKALAQALYALQRKSAFVGVDLKVFNGTPFPHDSVLAHTILRFNIGKDRGHTQVAFVCSPNRLRGLWAYIERTTVSEDSSSVRIKK